MKNIFSWLKNSTKVKRWIALIVVGVILACYGFSSILVLEELKIKDIIKIIITFVTGFTCFIIGLLFMQRRTLELAIDARKDLEKDVDMSDTNTLVSPKGVYGKGPKIVVIGGGTGINNVLKGLKHYTSNISAVVSVSSYGNIPNVMKRELKLKPIEDIKNGIISLADNSEEMEKIMNYEFKEGKIKSYNFGDIYISAMQDIYGDFSSSIDKCNKMLSIVGRVLPVTLDEMNICAELQDGTVIEEKSKIAEKVIEKVTRINRVFISPTTCRATPEVIEAIKDADAIVIGPGSLYTNVIPNLLVKNVAKTIKESKAIKIYISNIMTEPGNTDDYSVSDHIKAIVEHAGKDVIKYCISDVGVIIPEFIRKYNMNGSNWVDVDTQKIKDYNVSLIKEELAVIEGEHIRHDSNKLAKTIVELIYEDLKFRDKQSDDQFLLLNAKLKEENKKEKTRKQEIKKEKPKKKKEKSEGRKSKFSSKYKDRIMSIRETEVNRQKNIELHKKAREITLNEEKKEKEKFLKDTYTKK